MDINDKTYRALSLDFDIISDANTHEGDWYGLVSLGAKFPNDVEGMIVNGSGKNLSPLNDLLPDGYEVRARFNRVTLTGGVALAYKG